MLTLKAQTVQKVRTLSLALVLAMAGFCYSFATSPSGAAQSRSVGGAEIRSVGSSALRFTNALSTDPAANNAFDLGDACFGSDITRYVTATGGVRPYKFTAVGLNINPPSSLALSASGCLMGSISTGTSPVSFQITATDNSLTPATVGGTFQINLFACDPRNAIFRFAVSNINNGILGISYISKLETLNGAAPVVFSVLPGTLAVNGVPKGVTGSLEAIGLSLAADGTITGRPTIAGLVTFTARATDRKKSFALDRGGTIFDQRISFNIEDNNLISTDYTLLSCSVKGDVGQVGKDSIKFSGVMNLRGQPLKTLFNSPFIFQLGGATFSGRFNLKGQVVNSRGGPAIFADGSQMKATVNAQTGRVQGTITKATLGKLLDAVNIQNRSLKRYGAGSNICSLLLASNLLEFVTRKSGDKFMLDYNLGKLGSSIGGNFQVLTVKGQDANDVAGNPGDAWSVQFIAVPRFGIDTNPGLDAISSVGFRIGANYNQRIDKRNLVSDKNGSTKLLSKNPAGTAIAKFSLDARKFLGVLQTSAISRVTTGIPQAKGAAAASTFNFGFDILRTENNAPFVGEGSKVIVAGQHSALNNHQWVDQDNKR